mmetsp:Transcript_28402/g.78272  ORF Transcript_28402/g.78272 Transcript_28402/m.78272 type:complete len:132 (+) Transcript_28402:78-473(+)
MAENDLEADELACLEAEAEALLVDDSELAALCAEPAAAAEPEVAGEDGEEDLGGTEDDREDPSGPSSGNVNTKPLYCVGQVVSIMSSEGVHKLCDVVAVDNTDVGPMYAIRFKDGLVQCAVLESDLRLGAD